MVCFNSNMKPQGRLIQDISVIKSLSANILLGEP